MASLYGSSSSPKVELLINNAWTDVTSDVRADARVNISRGAANEQSRVTAQTCDFTLKNRTGKYSNNNPLSPYYGLLPQATQVRVQAGVGESYGRYLWQPDNANGTAAYYYSADKAAYDITGDLDVRSEIRPRSWFPVNRYMIIAAKWSRPSDQRSWATYLTPDGKLGLTWCPTGAIASQLSAVSTVAIPTTSKRLAVRATIDVNNGAGGATIAFYTAPSIGGTWTQLGASVVKVGTTSIFSSTANITLGAGAEYQGIFTDGMGFGGRYYAFQMYNGIAGSQIVNLDFTTLTVGATSFNDTTGNAWLTTGAVRTSSDRVRFWGELASLRQDWDKSGTDVIAPLRAAGQIRRLTQGASPVNSPMYRNFTQYSPHGYWPLEDGADANYAASAVQGGTPARVTDVRFAQDGGLPGTKSNVAFNSIASRIRGTANTATATGTISIVFYVKVSALPVVDTTIAEFTTNGTSRFIRVALSNTSWSVVFVAADNTYLAYSSTPIGTISPVNRWVGFNICLQTTGSDMTYSLRWDLVSAFGGGIGPTTISSASVGRAFSFKLYASADPAYYDAQFAHVMMSTQNLDLSTSNFRSASNAYLGETSGARQARLSVEEGVAIEITGAPSDTEAMGYQSIATFMDLIYECWDTDRGLGGEARDALALQYVTRAALDHRSDFTLNYHNAEFADVPRPADDDQGVSNDVTVQRTGGASGRAVVTTGPTSISAPPSGIGPYETSLTLSVALDTRVNDLANWIAHIGSYPGSRYPTLPLGLHRTAVTASLAAALISADLGETAAITSLPAWLPPDAVSALLRGYTERLDRFMWDLTFNSSPGEPYETGRYDYTTETGVSLYDHGTSTTNGAHNSTTTSLGVTLGGGTPVTLDRWTTNPASFPFDIMVAGERMTVTAISGTTSPQTFTVTRSVNSVVKSIPAGSRVRLFRPVYWRL